MRAIGLLFATALLLSGCTATPASQPEPVAEAQAPDGPGQQEVTLNGWATPKSHSYADGWNCIQFTRPVSGLDATASWVGGPQRLRLAIQVAGDGAIQADAVGASGVHVLHTFAAPVEHARLFVVLPQEQLREEAVQQPVSLAFKDPAGARLEWEIAGICT